MVTVGVDAHTKVHAAVALDEAGREVGRWRGANSPAGWQQLAVWARELGGSRRWGVEGAWNYGRGLAQHLVAAGEVVYEVNARWTAQERRSARRPGKSDALDARAVATVVLREAPGLPLVHVDDETGVLDLLVTEREAAVGEATRLRNQIHRLLAQVDPEYRTRIPNLQTRSGLTAVDGYAVPDDASALDRERAAAVRRLARRLRLALDQIDELEEQIGERAGARFAPLTRLCGVNVLTAGALAGILGPGRRWRTDAQLAAYAGVAPLEASSAGLTRHRLNRGGNRRLNAILYRIALTQARHSAEARAYLDRRVAEGKTMREAFRALKRFLVRAVWRLWQECVASPTAAASAGLAT
jgi:transposase